MSEFQTTPIGQAPQQPSKLQQYGQYLVYAAIVIGLLLGVRLFSSNSYALEDHETRFNQLEERRGEEAEERTNAFRLLQLAERGLRNENRDYFDAHCEVLALKESYPEFYTIEDARLVKPCNDSDILLFYSILDEGK